MTCRLLIIFPNSLDTDQVWSGSKLFDTMKKDPQVTSPYSPSSFGVCNQVRATVNHMWHSFSYRIPNHLTAFFVCYAPFYEKNFCRSYARSLMRGPRKFCQRGLTLTGFSCFLVDEGREDPSITICGPSSARQRNAIKMAFRWRAYI